MIPVLQTSESNRGRTRFARLILLVGIFFIFFTFFRLPTLVGWDESFYLTQMSSAVLDKDLTLQDDLLGYPNPLSVKFRSLTVVKNNGALMNTFSIGPAVLHGFFLWPVCLVLRDDIWNDIRPYMAVETFFLLVIFLWATRSVIRSAGFKEFTAISGMFFSVFATPLMVYANRLYGSSHFLSAFWTVLLCLLLYRYSRHPDLTLALMSGSVMGMMIITRWQDILILFIFFPVAISLLKSRTLSTVTKSVHWAAASLMCLSICLLQLGVWKLQYGQFFLLPQGKTYLTSPAGQIIPFLISGYHGLLLWTPGFALGLFALLFIRFDHSRLFHRQVQLGFRALLPIILLICASPTDWWGGSSYGPRRLSSLIPFATLGFAGFINRLHPIFRVALIVLFVLFGILTATLYFAGIDDMTLAITGKDDGFHPDSESSDHSVLNYNRLKWTFRLVARPGFALVDNPRTPEKNTGAMVLMLTGLSAGGFIWLLRKNSHFRRMTLAVGCLWIAICLTAMFVWFPDNMGINRAWLDVLTGKDPSKIEEPVLRKIHDPANIVAAVRGAQRNDLQRFLDCIQRIDNPDIYGVDAATLIDFTRDPANMPLMEVFWGIRKYHRERPLKSKK